jgi:stage III sporulation protein SpoIIIAA
MENRSIGERKMSDYELELRDVLKDFSEKINGNERVQKLIRRWSTSVLMWSKDQHFGYVLEVSSGRVSEMRKAMSENEGNVKVVGSTLTLVNMLRGKENIAHLYMDGVVETYGSEKDQIVLDAVAKILWS